MLLLFTYRSRGLGQAKPEPSREWRLWPGLRFDKAKAASSQAKAGASRPSRAVHSPIQFQVIEGVVKLIKDKKYRAVTVCRRIVY